MKTEYIVTTKFPLGIAKTKPKPKDAALALLAQMKEMFPDHESSMIPISDEVKDD